MPNNKQIATEIEDYIKSELQERGLTIFHKTHDSDDGFYDFMISDRYIKIKSAQLINKTGIRGKKQRRIYGRFEFTRQGQLRELIEHKGIVVFIIRWGEQKIILGSLKAEKLLPIRKYYTPITIAELNPKPLDQLAEALKWISIK